MARAVDLDPSSGKLGPQHANQAHCGLQHRQRRLISSPSAAWFSLPTGQRVGLVQCALHSHDDAALAAVIHPDGRQEPPLSSSLNMNTMGARRAEMD